MRREPHKQQTELDTLVDIVTPENIRFSYRLAGPFVRMFAFLVDMILMHLLYGVYCLLLGIILYNLLLNVDETIGSVVNSVYQCLNLLVYFVLFWFGMAFCEAKFNGRTPAKALFRLRTITTDGLPVSMFQAFVRNIIRLADMAIGPITVLVMFSNNRFMRFGDIAAGTIVVFNDQANWGQELIHFENPEFLKLVKSIPVTFSVSEDLIKSLGLYIHRRTALTPQRRAEISATLAYCLMRRAGIPVSNVDPDTFLCAVYQWNLEERSIG